MLGCVAAQHSRGAMQPCCHCCSLCSSQVLALSARPSWPREAPDHLLPLIAWPQTHVRPSPAQPSWPGSPSPLGTAGPLCHSPNCPVPPDTHLLEKLNTPVQDLVGQQGSDSSLRAGLASAWHCLWLGTQSPGCRHILAALGEGSTTPPHGWGRAVCGCQAARSRQLSRKMQSAHVGLDVKHEMKAEGQNNIFSMPPCVYCVSTSLINRLIQRGLPVPCGK